MRISRARTWAVVAAATALAAALAGCGDDGGGLSGSLAARFDLSYDTVRVLRIGDDVAVEWVREEGGGTVIPFKIVAEGVDGLPAEAGTAALVVTRVVRDGGGGELPALEWGRLALDGGLAGGDTLSGEFDLRFVDGSDLSGEFAAVVEVP